MRKETNHVCGNCGTNFMRVPRRGKGRLKPSFCGKECQSRHKEKGEWKHCQCGKEFYSLGGIYCSISCSVKENNKLRKVDDSVFERNILDRVGLETVDEMASTLNIGVNRILRILSNNNLDRNGNKITCTGKLDIEFTVKRKKLWKAAERYLMFICDSCDIDYAIPCEDKSFDLLVDFGKGFEKIQVKSSIDGEFNICKPYSRLLKCQQPYSKEEVDRFFLFDGKRCWLIPYEEVKGQMSVTPDIKYTGYEVANFRLKYE